ncbi:hypothetical protein Rhopal_003223-T1 [Rhodotorula paludigena]|uniref:Paf1-domain-containing protein n=1 Tax=Rhodotorula paludigena TaxID=86838 RepID=A0AAV5GJX8_9BASI|nr:hypothetical protein Rhopal_003223-T1 [Rhodotorula paludigena]
MATQGSSSKTSLLVRVRYQNPLPPPPFPPRLLHIPTTPQRYASYDFLTPLQGERQLPVILDSELGLPLEYGRPGEGGHADGEYWMGNRSTIAPVKDVSALASAVDEDDKFLMEDAVSRPAPGAAAAGTDTPGRANVTDVSKKVDVSWLRKTEYLSSEAGGSRQALGQLNGTPKREQAALNPLDRDGRAAAISATFDAAHTPLSELRHPTKKHLTAVESFDLLPDADLWANEFDLVRFGEDPSSQGMNDLPRLGPDPRLPRALLRDLSAEFPEGEGRVAYYLPSDDANAVAYTQKRYDGEETFEGETFDFRWVRDYELASSRPLTQEFIVAFDAGADATEGEQRARPRTTQGRGKGAYYAPLQSTMQLRKRRPRKGEDPRVFPEQTEEKFWDGISLTLHHPLAIFPEEEQERYRGFKAEVEVPPEDLVVGGAAPDESGAVAAPEAGPAPVEANGGTAPAVEALGNADGAA